jgi:hypothetical protein
MLTLALHTAVRCWKQIKVIFNSEAGAVCVFTIFGVSLSWLLFQELNPGAMDVALLYAH